MRKGNMNKYLMIIGITLVLVAGLFRAQLSYHGIDSMPSEAPQTYYSSQGLLMESINHQGRGASENRPFSREEGDAFGLDKHRDFSALDFMGPFLRSSAIASGDFNNDGWQDIVLGDKKGILLYRNLGTSRFALQEITIPQIGDNIIVVAFVDIDNDGWQDIYLASYGSYGGKNHFLLNDREGFQNPQVIPALNEGAEVPQAVSFGDIDKDGYLDFVNGNAYPFVAHRKSPPLSAANKIVMNKGSDFLEDNLQETIGQTFSVLLSDFTNDHNLDLIIGNDGVVSDIFYTGSETGVFKKILATDKVVPISVTSNMSVDVADFNNDLYMDIYLGGISPVDFSLEGVRNNYCFEIKSSEEKQKCENNLKINTIIKKENIEQCAELRSPRDKNDCAVIAVMKLAVKNRDESLCKKIPEDYKTQLSMCHRYFASEASPMGDFEEDIPQKKQENVLLQGSKQGVFQDVSSKTGSAKGGWTWNAKFADLDNDEWQDIYVANGRWVYHPPHSNVFFHNKEGQFFETAQEKFNLENFNMVVAYTYIDIDNDGDLDIVSAGLNGPINVYVNNETRNNSITFQFRDQKGNYFGIGNKVYIYYGENSERYQVREVKSGGGFVSFDSPIAHFGLGKYDEVNKVEIVWSTGEKNEIEKEFLANKNYVIERKK